MKPLKHTYKYVLVGSFIILRLCFGLAGAQAQQATDTLPTPTISPKVLWPVMGGAYVGGLAGLATAWYGDSLTSFHWFNDNQQWQQMDKLGHAHTAYHLSRVGGRAFSLAGYSPKTSAWLGFAAGFVFQTPIEIMDAFSPNYGASWGDLIANTAGSALYLAQQLAWQNQVFQLKYSFRPTAYANLRPNLLGHNLTTQWLKDYNGQTYWLTINSHSAGGWLQRHTPQWLNLAVGYGAHQMVSASPQQNQANGYTAYRQFYFSLDIATDRIKTRSKVLNTLLFVTSAIKIPLPTIEVNTLGQWHYHWLWP